MGRLLRLCSCSWRHYIYVYAHAYPQWSAATDAWNREQLQKVPSNPGRR